MYDTACIKRVWFNDPFATYYTVGDFGVESFQEINSTGTDNQKIHKKLTWKTNKLATVKIKHAKIYTIKP